METPEPRELPPKDVSADFLSMTVFNFNEHLDKTLKNERSLLITVDLSSYPEDKFNWVAIRLKAFLESRSPNQKRLAIIRCKAEQRQWGANAFNSGVKCELIS